MLMSRPGIRLQAINRELMRLVVCLGAVVTHLKDGLCPEPQGSVIDPSRGILPRLYSPFSKMLFRLSKIILYWGNFIIHKMQCLDIGDDVYLCWEGGDDALTQTGQCGNTKGWMQGEWWGCSCAATCQAWEPVCVYSRETVPIQNNERTLPLLNNKKAILLPPPKLTELEIESQHKSLQSVGSLVWQSAVPKLRSLSTEPSQAKHIFIDCVCVFLKPCAYSVVVSTCKF